MATHHAVRSVCNAVGHHAVRHREARVINVDGATALKHTRMCDLSRTCTLKCTRAPKLIARACRA
eukprot:1209692-Pleurochrysis_carterae.AAC.2